MENCLGYRNSVQKVIYCPNMRSENKGSVQAQSNGHSSEASKRNNFYALHSSGEQEQSLDMITGILQVFSIDFYALLDAGDTLLFVTSLVATKYDIPPDVLIEPFFAITLVGDFIMASRILGSRPISFPNKVTWVDFVEHDIVDFDVILITDWLHYFFASIDCRTRVVKLNFFNEPIIEMKKGVTQFL